MLCYVRVFLLSVDHQLDHWPEQAERECRWVGPLQAAEMVREGELAEILRGGFPLIERLERKWELNPAKRPHLPR